MLLTEKQKNRIYSEPMLEKVQGQLSYILRNIQNTYIMMEIARVTLIVCQGYFLLYFVAQSYKNIFKLRRGIEFCTGTDSTLYKGDI